MTRVEKFIRHTVLLTNCERGKGLRPSTPSRRAFFLLRRRPISQGDGFLQPTSGQSFLGSTARKEKVEKSAPTKKTCWLPPSTANLKPVLKDSMRIISDLDDSVKTEANSTGCCRARTRGLGKCTGVRREKSGSPAETIPEM